MNPETKTDLRNVRDMTLGGAIVAAVLTSIGMVIVALMGW